MRMESKFVQAGPVKLEYFEHGHGLDTVVLVHGYTTSAAIWRYTLDSMSEDRFRVIVLNNRGAGNSDRTPNEEDYSVETIACDLFSVTEALKLDGFTLVGHSMGGGVVAKFALEHQDRIKGLVLMNSTPLNGRELHDGWDEELRETLRDSEPPLGDMGLASADVTDDFKEAVMADIARNPVERYIGGRRSMAALRLRDRLSEIKVPTLVIGCDKDERVRLENILSDYQEIPEEHRHLQIYHGFGHSPNVEIGRRIAGVIERFSDMAWDLDMKAEASR